MTELISSTLPYAILVSHLFLLALFVSILLGNGFARFVGKHAVMLGLLVSITAVAGSLFYSNIVGFLPCDLCWWQRIFIYPSLPLFAVALYHRDAQVFRYMTPLAIIASIISVYHLFVQMGGNSILPCSASASCDKLYVFQFGYVTIPTMALTVSLAFLLLAWARKKHA